MLDICLYYYKWSIIKDYCNLQMILNSSISLMELSSFSYCFNIIVQEFSSFLKPERFNL